MERIVVHAPDNSSGNREQKEEIYFRFNVASVPAMLDDMTLTKRKRPRSNTQPFKISKVLLYCYHTFGRAFFISL